MATTVETDDPLAMDRGKFLVARLVRRRLRRLGRLFDRGSWHHDTERDTFTLVFQRDERPVYQATFLPFELRYALRNRRELLSLKQKITATVERQSPSEDSHPAAAK